MQPEVAYDYKRQTWLTRWAERLDGAWIWRVRPCNHADARQPGCCYAAQHADELIVHHEQIH